MTSNVISYKGFSAVIEYDDESERFFCDVMGIEPHGIHFDGTSVKELKKHMKESVDAYLEFCRDKKIQPKKAYSGRITYRTSPDIHAELALLARMKGKQSISGFIDDAVIRYKSELLENRT